jgi:hypothetical protein
MAREHARIQTAIWIDDDFLDLTPEAQHLYLVLATQMKLSFCGVTSWHPGKLSQLAAKWTPARVEGAAKELSDHRYIVIDADTDEVLVRSFIRSDGLLSSPNISKAMYRTFSDIGSRNIRGVVVHELLRLHAENPQLKGFEACSELLAKRAIDPADLDPFNPSINPSVNPSEPVEANPSNDPSDTPYSLLPTPYSRTPDSPRKPRGQYSEDFERVYALYPWKVGKKAAAASFAKALKEVSVEEIAAGVVRYRDDTNRKPGFTKQFSTWLNQGCWDDEPLPARDGQQSGSSLRLHAGLERLAQYDKELEIEGPR